MVQVKSTVVPHSQLIFTCVQFIVDSCWTPAPRRQVRRRGRAARMAGHAPRSSSIRASIKTTTRSQIDNSSLNSGTVRSPGTRCKERHDMSEAATYQYYAGGEWRDASEGATFDVHEPYSRKLMHRIAACGPAETRIAIDAAARAFPIWSAMTPAEKAALFFKAAAIVRSRSGEIADLLSRETGSTISFSAFQQHLVVETLEAAAGWGYHARGEVFPTNMPGRHSFSVRRP